MSKSCNAREFALSGIQTVPSCAWINSRIRAEQKALSPKTVLPLRFTLLKSSVAHSES